MSPIVEYTAECFASMLRGGKEPCDCCEHLYVPHPDPSTEQEARCCSDCVEMNWKWAWRVGFAPQYSDKALRSFLDALERGDPKLMQKGSVLPLHDGSARPQRVCGVAYCEDAESDAGLTVDRLCAAVDRAFAAADALLGVQCGFRTFVGWFDSNDWSTVRKELIAEVRSALEVRDAL